MCRAEHAAVVSTCPLDGSVVKDDAQKRVVYPPSRRTLCSQQHRPVTGRPVACNRSGPAAEKLDYGMSTTGAENDLQQVTEIARHMVLRWG